mgnify:FL=1
MTSSVSVNMVDVYLYISMMNISFNFVVDARSHYKILVNDKPIDYNQKDLFISCVQPPKLNWIDFVGDLSIKSLHLDGIDLLDFHHHGFTSNNSRGNQDSKNIRYYFKTPIWHWFCTWRIHDHSFIRTLSKNHQGFVPL